MADQTRPDPDYRELGVTGLKRAAGYVYEEIEPEFQGAVWRRTIAKMEHDPIIGAMLFVIEMLIRRIPWPIKAAADTPEEATKAEFIRGCFDDMTPTWTDTLAEILTMLPYGWAFHEVVYKKRLGSNPQAWGLDYPDDPSYVPPVSKFNDGKIGWHRWGGRAQTTLLHWEFNDKGDMLGMVQLAPPDFKLQFIPATKGMLFRTTSRYNNPEGRSILRGAYSSWYFKNNIQRIEAIGVERDLAGLPVAFVPPELLSTTANESQKALLARIKQIVTNIRRDEQEGIIWPLAYTPEHGKPMFDIKLLSTGGVRQFNTEAIIGRYDQRIAMSVVADFILVGHESVGAYSLSQDKTDLFFTAIEAWLDAIADVINRKAIPDLLRLNGYDTEQMPILTHGEVRKISLAELGDFISKTSGAGVLLPDKELENFVRGAANLPLVPPEEDREYTTPQSQGDQTGLTMKGNPKGDAKRSTNLPNLVPTVQKVEKKMSYEAALAILEAASKVLSEQ